jgi:hypothetical protein
VNGTTRKRALCGEPPELTHLSQAQIGVGAETGAFEAPGLNMPSSRNPLAVGGRRLAQPLAQQLLVVHARHVDVDLDAVEQRPRDVLLLACDD